MLDKMNKAIIDQDELDELKRKADAFDYIAGIGSLVVIEQYYSLALTMERSVSANSLLLDVEKAVRCQSPPDILSQLR